ncbi:hypothetical protein [Methylobacterium sp. ID0610]|uniref:hypothetical protein n=1 Tax=Methylobacterium carpenticola TaxID=3344827 RepID=UPI0036A3F803
MAEKIGGKSTKPKGIHPEVLKSLVGKCQGIKADLDEARGELGSAIKDAEETHGINRPAFKLAMKLQGMETDKRRDFMRSLADYCDKLGLNDQADMFEDPPKVDPGVAQGAENAERIKAGVKKLEPAVH